MKKLWKFGFILSALLIQVATIGSTSGNPNLLFFTFERSYGTNGVANTDFGDITDVFYNGTDLLITDLGNSRVEIYTPTMDYETSFGVNGSGPGQFYQPSSIVSWGNKIYVADQGLERIQIFDSNGNYISQFGSNGTGNGQFRDLAGIATNGTNLLVADFSNSRIQIFDMNGVYKGQFGTYGFAAGQLWAPYDVTMNSTNIFVTDTGNQMVDIFDLAGNFVSQVGGLGKFGTNTFEYLDGIALMNGYIIVDDWANDYFMVLDASLNYVTRFGHSGSDDGGFNVASEFTIMGNYVVIADSFNFRITFYQAHFEQIPVTVTDKQVQTQQVTQVQTQKITTTEYQTTTLQSNSGSSKGGFLPFITPLMLLSSIMIAVIIKRKKSNVQN